MRNEDIIKNLSEEDLVGQVLCYEYGWFSITC